VDHRRKRRAAPVNIAGSGEGDVLKKKVLQALIAPFGGEDLQQRQKQRYRPISLH